jgi:hypothetical protein
MLGTKYLRLHKGIGVASSNPVEAAALRRADSPSKESYQWPLRFIISELFRNRNKPWSLIRQCGRGDIVTDIHKPIQVQTYIH